jgi:uncharacterized repeat protein (TIGR01451 family)
MKNVIRGGGSNASRRSERTRIVALAATFLLLLAGVLVSAPGLLTANATGSAHVDNGHDDGDDASSTSDDENQNEHEDEGDDHHGHHEDECENQDEHEDDDDDATSTSIEDDDEDDDDASSTSVEDDDENDDDDASSTSVEDDDENDDDDASSTSVDDEDNNKSALVAESNKNDADDDDNASSTSVEDDDENDDDASSTSVEDDDENDDDDASSTSVEDDDDDDDATSTTIDDDDDDDDDDATSTTIEDDDDDEACDATVTLFKTPKNEHGGDLEAADFQLLIDGQPQDQNVAITVTPDVAHEIGEIDQPGYELLAVLCYDDESNEQLDGGETITLAPGQHVTCEVINEDIAPTVMVHKEVVTDNGGMAQPQDFQMILNDDPIAQDAIYELVANEPSVVSEDDSVPGYAPTSVVCESDIADSPNNKTVTDTGAIDITPMLGENIYCVITNDDVAPGLTVVKELDNGDGGNEEVTDFPLQVNGDTVASGELIAYEAEVDLAITETQQPGWVAKNIHCESSDPFSTNNLDIDNPDDSTTLATISLQAGESVVCTITNDDIAPTVAVHKVVATGDKPASEFQMTLDGAPVEQDVASPTFANTPIEVSELDEPDYELVSVVCTNDADDSPLVHPLVLDEGQNATCTVTNALKTATITVVKDVQHPFGGTLESADFQLKIDDLNATQGTPHAVSAGAHTVSELQRPGYEQTSIVCTDTATDEPVGQGGAVTLDAGQDVSCVVTNTDIAPTLTVVKSVINNDNGNAEPLDFDLLIDDLGVTQGDPNELQVGTHTISEVDVAGYRMVSITCLDNDSQEPVVYNDGVTLALAENVTCTVTNDDDPIDLSITKSDDGLVKVAGGPSFDYTITVDNLGPRDAAADEAVTVTDQLPVGFAFVLPLPAGCSAVGQTLTCTIAPADLQVADAPVVLTVHVRALPDAPSGTYTNMAYVNTPEDPACIGAGCVPVCDPVSNNVACEDTDITRQASITVDKVDNVDGPIQPGQVYSYFITVANAGPSTFLANLTLTDDLPAELQLQSVSAGALWTCNAVDPVVCNYTANLQPGTTTAPITIVVRLDPNFLGNNVLNEATAIAVVDPPPVTEQAASIHAQTTSSDPGTVVTATDDENTPVVRNADLVIDKTVSQATAAVGDQFNWLLDITNNGPNAATDIVISDSIPAQFEVIAAFPPAGVTCTNTTSDVSCTAPSLFVGASLHVIIQVRVIGGVPAGTYTNTATVSASSTDPNPANNTDSAAIDVSGSESSPPTPPDTGAGAPTPELPRTGGSSPAGPLTLAALLVAGGICSLVIGRRRRAASTQ